MAKLHKSTVKHQAKRKQQTEAKGPATKETCGPFNHGEDEEP
jgi:hypothetical protein